MDIFSEQIDTLSVGHIAHDPKYVAPMSGRTGPRRSAYPRTFCVTVESSTAGVECCDTDDDGPVRGCAAYLSAPDRPFINVN